MGNPFVNSGLTCCERQDETKYVHGPCGCPAASLITKSEQKNATLCGFSENEDSNNGVTASVPPKKYKKVTAVISDYQYQDLACCNASGQKPNWGVKTDNERTLTDAGSHVRDYSANLLLDPPLCSDDNTYSSGEYAYTEYFICPQTVQSTGTGSLSLAILFGTSFSSTTFSEGPYNTLRVEEATSNTVTKFRSQSYDLRTGTCYDPDDNPLPAYEDYECKTVTTTLSLEDTEADALNRATEGEGTSNISILEDRTTGFSFTKRTVDYAILLKNLVVGLDYEGEVPVDSGVAEAGSSVSYSADTPDTFSFTATKKFHIEGGTLNASISDQDFIDNNYALNPTVYGLSADADVITPTTALTHSQGMAYRLGTPYVEKSA